MKYPLFALPFLVVLLTACPDSTDDGVNGSGDFPADPVGFTISTYEGGGMLPISFNSYISEDSAFWGYDRYNNETVIRWVPGEDEFKELYQTVIDNKVDKIKSDCEGEVYDRGGLSIEITIDGKSYQLDHSGNCFVQDKWKSNYGAIVSAIDKHTKSAIDEQMIALPLVATDNLMNCGYDIKVSTNQQAYYTFNADTTEREVLLYPGINEFNINLMYKDSVNHYGRPAHFDSEQFFIKINTETSQLTVDWKDEAVWLEGDN